MIDSLPSLSLESQQITPKRLEWIMDVGHCTVADWNEKKLIPHFKLERIIRYAPENVLNFILSHTVRARAAAAPSAYSSSPTIHRLSEDAWKQIERLIADQVQAQKEKAA